MNEITWRVIKGLSFWSAG